MSSEWVIDPVSGQYENQLLWVIKGNNQFADSFQHSTLGDNVDESPTIEFLNGSEALLTMGKRKFTLSLQHVDYLVCILLLFFISLCSNFN